jgi:hypothetical protein
MQTQSRIPKLNEISFDGALMWFAELQVQGLLFHPEDDPADIIKIADGSATFSSQEVTELRFLMDELENGIGHKQVIDAAYPIAMNAFLLPLDA